MPILRRTAFLARLVLAWFVLHLGAGIAAPAVQPGPFQVVCAAGVLKLVPDGGQQSEAAAGGIDCPLCSPALALPPAAGEPHLARLATEDAASQPPAVAPRFPAALPPARAPPLSSQA